MDMIFKAKSLDNGEWKVFNLFGDYPTAKDFYFYSKDEDYSLELQGFVLDKNTICQYTGIKDSEGNRIFEGDEIYVAGVGTVFVNITANGAFFGAYECLVVFEDIEKLTGHNIHDRGMNDEFNIGKY